jgi:hypothetical protein
MWALTVLCALPVVPGLVGVAFLIAARVGVPLVGAWGATLYASSLDRRDLHGPARLVRATATAVVLVVVAMSGARFVDGVVTIL